MFIIKYSVKGNTGYISNSKIHESFILGSHKSENIFFHTIVKKHFKEYDGNDPDNLYSYDLGDMEYLKEVIQENMLYSPTKIECVEKNNALKVVKKHFSHLQEQLA